MFSPLQNTERSGVFLREFNSVFKGNNVWYTPASNLDYILSGDTCVSSIHQNRPIFHKVNVFPHLKMLTDRKYSLHMLTQFSKRDCVQNITVSNLDHIPRGDTCVPSIHQNRPIFHKVKVSPT
jgi:hypothetical protein